MLGQCNVTEVSGASAHFCHGGKIGSVPQVPERGLGPLFVVVHPGELGAGRWRSSRFHPTDAVFAPGPWFHRVPWYDNMSTGAGNSVLWKLISAIFSCFERLKLRLENTDANEISSNDRRDVTQTTRLAILALAGENEFKVVIKRLLHACDFTDEVTNLLRSHSRPHRTHNALGDNIASAIGPYKEEFVGSLKIIVAKFKRLFRLLKEDISEVSKPSISLVSRLYHHSDRRAVRSYNRSQWEWSCRPS